MKLKTTDGNEIWITGGAFLDAIVPPSKNSPNPNLLRFIQLFWTHMRGISGERKCDDKADPKKFLDIKSRILVGDETCAAIAVSGDKFLIASNRNKHSKDQISFAVSVQVDSATEDKSLFTANYFCDFTYSAYDEQGNPLKPVEASDVKTITYEYSNEVKGYLTKNKQSEVNFTFNKDKHGVDFSKYENKTSRAPDKKADKIDYPVVWSSQLDDRWNQIRVGGWHVVESDTISLPTTVNYALEGKVIEVGKDMNSVTVKYSCIFQYQKKGVNGEPLHMVAPCMKIVKYDYSSDQKKYLPDTEGITFYLDEKPTPIGISIPLQKFAKVEGQFKVGSELLVRNSTIEPGTVSYNTTAIVIEIVADKNSFTAEYSCNFTGQKDTVSGKPLLIQTRDTTTVKYYYSPEQKRYVTQQKEIVFHSKDERILIPVVITKLTKFGQLWGPVGANMGKQVLRPAYHVYLDPFVRRMALVCQQLALVVYADLHPNMRDKVNEILWEGRANILINSLSYELSKIGVYKDHIKPHEFNPGFSEIGKFYEFLAEDYERYKQTLKVTDTPQVTAAWWDKNITQQQLTNYHAPEFIKQNPANFLRLGKEYFIDLIKLEAMVHNDSELRRKLTNILIKCNPLNDTMPVEIVDHGDDNLHAEMRLLVHHLQQHGRSMADYFGITMLCCGHCNLVMSQMKQVDYRGTHAEIFPTWSFDDELLKPENLSTIFGTELYELYKKLQGEIKFKIYNESTKKHDEVTCKESDVALFVIQNLKLIDNDVALKKLDIKSTLFPDFKKNDPTKSYMYADPNSHHTSTSASATASTSSSTTSSSTTSSYSPSQDMATLGAATPVAGALGAVGTFPNNGAPKVTSSSDASSAGAEVKTLDEGVYFSSAGSPPSRG